MCGICGFNYENKSMIKKMCDLIYHRGPDDWGYFTNSKLSLGMRRLSIIDINTGHQPQHNENEDKWIVFNGEIYNFLKLRDILEKKGHKFYTNSDTEVIIHAYEEWGYNCVKKFRGQFVFCIYDSKKELLILARDHIGLKPLYYYFDGEKFIFGSEIKCILCHNIKREVDRNAFNLYLSLSYTPFNQTLFKGIYKLPPSSYLIFNLTNKKIEIKKYWKINFKIDRNNTKDHLATELRKLLEESVKIRLIGEVPLGVYLSGGIDSSSIVALMSKFMNKPVKTFSIGFEKGAPVNEIKYSRFIADYFNTDHKELTIKSTCYDILPQLIWYFDDLIADPAIIPIYFMAKSARENITVVLTGDGADEVFAGYAEWYGLNRKNYFRIIPLGLINKLLKFYYIIPSHKVQIILTSLKSSITDEDRFFKPLLYIKDIEKKLVVPFKIDNVQNLLKKNLIKNLDLINQYINYDINYQLPNRFNMKTDKINMAASLEARVPFLDQKIIDWSSTLPSELKLNGNTEKYILRLAIKDLLPPQILKRKKLGFGTPVNLWLKTGMDEISSELLERLEKRKKIIKSEYVRKVRKNKKSTLYQHRVWILIMFELWHETFIDKDGLHPLRF